MFADSQARKSLNVAGILLKFHVAGYMKLVEGELACHNSHFSLLLAAGNFKCEEERLRLSDRNSVLRWKVLTGQTRLISL